MNNINSVVNNVPYLRTTREFPLDPNKLTQEVSKSYLDIANAVNSRTIGIYPKNKPSITGNNYFLNSGRQQSLRQVYTFGAIANGSTIDLGFKLASINQIILMYGTYLSGTSYFGLIPADTTAITGQISFYIAVNGSSTSSDVITFVVDAPSITSGSIVVEWIANA
jgi:hypothetical protein